MQEKYSGLIAKSNVTSISKSDLEVLAKKILNREGFIKDAMNFVYNSIEYKAWADLITFFNLPEVDIEMWIRFNKYTFDRIILGLEDECLLDNRLYKWIKSNRYLLESDTIYQNPNNIHHTYKRKPVINLLVWEKVFDLCKVFSDPDWVDNELYVNGKAKILLGNDNLESKEFSMIKKAIMSAKMKTYRFGNHADTVFLRYVEKEDVTYNNLLTQYGSCYIATFAYGDYENYQVVKLRNFRDNKLSRSDFGRFFIKSYYYFSPFLVRLFSDNTIVRFYSRRVLDAIISYLEKRNYI